MIKGFHALMMMASMMGGMDNAPRGSVDDIDFTPRTKPIPKGCKRYQFGDFSCIASSERVARKKYSKWLASQSVSPTNTDEG